MGNNISTLRIRNAQSTRQITKVKIFLVKLFLRDKEDKLLWNIILFLSEQPSFDPKYYIKSGTTIFFC